MMTRSSSPTMPTATERRRTWLDLSRRESGAGRLVLRAAPSSPLPRADLAHVAAAAWSEREDGWVLGRVWDFEVFEVGLALAAEPGVVVLPRASAVLGVAGGPAPLTVELVPEPCRATSSSTVLGEEAWRQGAEAFVAASGGRCTVCGRTANLVADVYAYLEPEDPPPAAPVPDLRVGIRRFVGWELSCPLCWVARRPGLATTAPASDAVSAHLAAVNDWKPEEAERAVARAWRTWRRRSVHAWRDDFGLLLRVDPAPGGRAPAVPPAPRIAVTPSP